MANCSGNKVMSGLDKDVFAFTWVIENFREMAENPVLLNKQHTAVIKGENKWTLYMCAYGNKNKITIICAPYGEGHDERTPIVSLEVVIPLEEDNDEDVLFRGKTDVIQITKYNDADSTNSMYDNQVLYEEICISIGFQVPLVNLPLVNGSLIFHIKLVEYSCSNLFDTYSPCQLPVTNTSAVIVEEHEKESVQGLLKDMKRLYKSGEETSDFKIITDNKEFLVHKQVISARSLVFSAMIQSQFSEQKTGEVKVTDVTSGIMDILLEFLYTGNLQPAVGLDVNELLDLAYAAEKYAVNGLLKFCDDALAEKCNKNNATQLFTMCKNLNLSKASETIVQCLKGRLGEVNEEEDIVYLIGKLDARSIIQGDN